jgi:hypothetical protein
MTTPVQVRPAHDQDLPKLLELARLRRVAYERYQPVFWRPAADAVESQRAFFTTLLQDPDVRMLVADLDEQLIGFAIARVVSAPPVFDPGGATCMVDDFTVDTDEHWPLAGPPLLGAVRSWSATRGASQLVVVTAQLDAAKRTALGDAGLSPASEWWVGPTS